MLFDYDHHSIIIIYKDIDRYRIYWWTGKVNEECRHTDKDVIGFDNKNVNIKWRDAWNEVDVENVIDFLIKELLP